MRHVVLVLFLLMLQMSAVSGNIREKRWFSWGRRWVWSCDKVEEELDKEDANIPMILRRATKSCLLHILGETLPAMETLSSTMADLESTLNSTQFAVGELEDDLARCQENQECENIDNVLSGVNDVTIDSEGATSGIITITCTSGTQLSAACTEVAENDFQWTIPSVGALNSSVVREEIETVCAPPPPPECENLDENPILDGIADLSITPSDATSGTVTVTCFSGALSFPAECVDGQWTDSDSDTTDVFVGRIQVACSSPFRK